jgi:autophagy-related protein 9
MEQLQPLLANLSEDFLLLVYKYYELRGYKNIFLIKINNLIATLFLLFVIIFVTTFINYATLFSSYKLEDAIDFNRQIHPILIVYIVFFFSYWCWKLAKTVYDLKKFYTIHTFYKNSLMVDDFQLQNTNWLTIRDAICIEGDDVDKLIMRKENFTLGIMRHVLKYHSWISLSKIMEWELTFIIFMYLFKNNGKTLNEPDEIDNSGLKKRLKLIGIINIFVIPFLLIFSGVYVVFRYGEVMYTKSRYITSREWSKWVRFMKIRRYDELPHNFENRIHKAKKYADKYYAYFRPSLLYNLAQLVLIILTIILGVFGLLIILNFNFLIKFENCFQYISIVFTTILMLKNYLNKYTKIIGSEEKIQKNLNKILDILQIDRSTFIESANSRNVFREFSSKWYYSRIKIIILEIWGIFTLPYIFIKTLPDFSNSIIEFISNNTIKSDSGDYLVSEDLLINTI